MKSNRRTGKVAGYARLVGLASLSLRGAALIAIAHKKGGLRGARSTFAGIARKMTNLFGLEIEVEGGLAAEGDEVRVANHQTYLDILVLSGLEAGRFLAMREVADWAFVGRVAKQIGCVFVDRDRTADRRRALRELEMAAKSGIPVIVFPEGKTAIGDLLSFQPGAFVAAQRAAVPVRPVAIRYERPDEVGWIDDMTLFPHMLGRLGGPKVRVRVMVLAPIASAKDAAGLAEAARSAIAEALHHDTK